MTYADLYERVLLLRRRIAGAAISRHESLAVVLPNCAEFAISFFAAADLGVRFLPVNPLLTSGEILRHLVDGSARLLITDRRRAEVCRAAVAAARTPVDLMFIEDGEPAPISRHAAEVDADPDDEFLVQFSSGSTGRLKQVRRTQRQLAGEARNFALGARMSGDDRVLCVVPLNHAHGLGNGLLAAMYSGGTLVLDQLEGATPSQSRCQAILGLIERERITVFPGVPYLFEALAHTPRDQGGDLSSLRLCFSAGNTLPRSTFDRFLDRFGVPVRQLYGCTEAGSISLNSDDDVSASCDSVGTPLGSVEVRIASATGEEMPTGGDGDIWLRSPAVCDGYVGAPDDTAASYRDGYFVTGDIGRKDDAARIWIVGRRRRFIDTGGYKVDPHEVEQVLTSHEKVTEAAVVGVGASGPGELIKAVVVCQDGCTRPELLQHCRARLASYKVPAIIEMVDALPRSPLGKILRGPLMEAGGTPLPADIETHARRALAQLLGLDAAGIERDRPLMEYGLDSARAVQLAQQLEAALHVPVPATLIWSHPTLAAIGSLAVKPVARGGAAAHVPTREPIAVIGMGCRFPGGADGPEAFWRLLVEERDGITEVPPSRWDVDAFYDPNPETPGKLASRWGGFLDGVDRFDAGFFGISPREAAAMDPQQRVLLEVAWEALEHAGQDARRLAGSETGTFIGVLGDDYAFLQSRDPSRLDVYSGTGSAHNIVAGRIAYLFDLRGPAVALDTACSSSLVAVHAACQSLRTGESAMAIAGGVNLILTPQASIGLSRMRMLSPHGRCKAFDSGADGFVRSEGCGVVVLKRLSDALRDGDSILGVIRGSAVNQDGKSAGLTAPNGLAQQAVLRQALANAGMAAEGVEYIETHGAGTSLGDPIEVEAIRAVYDQPNAPPCVLGAVKTNLGHTEAAAGIAGLIKAVLALNAEAIPGNLHLHQPNPNLPLAGTRLELAKGVRPWPRREAPRCAAVSSFGWSGTNAHVVIEEAPRRGQRAAGDRTSYLLPVSARGPEAARAMLARYAAIPESESLQAVCACAALHRTHHRYRAAAVAARWPEMRAALALADVREAADAGGVVFVFPGQGGQWPGMGRELYREEAAFRQVIQECSAAIAQEAGWDLEASIRDGAEWDAIDRVQPALMSLSLALAAQWRHWGVTPAVVVGHSMGEVAAAHVAGALSLEEAVQVICRRSRLLKTLTGRGGMGVVELGMEATAAALARFDGRLSIAASNSRRTTVVSGDRDALDAAGREWEAAGTYWRQVQVDVASHCGHVDGLRPGLEHALAGLRPKAAVVRMQSTVTGAKVAGPELDAAYWVANVREPVRFADVIEALVGEGFRRFIEVGPHGVLLNGLTEALGDRNGIVTGSLRRGEPDRAALLQGLGAVYQSGIDIDWAQVNGPATRPVALPAYPWQRQRYWLDEAVEPGPAPRSPAAFAVAGDRDLRVWSLDVEEGHRVGGRDVMAGADYVEAVLRGVTAAHGSGDWEVRDVEWSGFLERGRHAQLVVEDDRFRIHSREEGEAGWRRHGAGRVVRRSWPRRREDIAAILGRCQTRVGEADFYQRLAGHGVELSGPYRQVREAWIGSQDVLARVQAARLDACLQPVSWCGPWAEGEIRVPVRVARVALGPEFAGEVWAWARWRDEAADVVILNDAGEVIGEVEGLELARAGWADGAWLWALQWERAARGPNREPHGRYLVIGDSEADALAAELTALGATAGAGVSADPLARASNCRAVIWLGGGDGIDAVVDFAQRLLRQGWREVPELVLVSRGTQDVADGATRVEGAGLWGLGRTLTYEHPELRCRLIDSTVSLGELAAEIVARGDEDQVALRPDGRYVARLRPLGETSAPDPRVAAAGQRSFRLEVDAPGVIDRLTWRTTNRRRPGPGQVEVEVAAAGLNFLDALWALGEYPGQARGTSGLGREFAGRVVAVGRGGGDLREGDAVVGCAEGSLATYVLASAATLARMPDGLDWLQASGQAVAYTTAYYALIELARLRAGERVLIHSAASGTGLAALEIAQQLGAEVWATAGTLEKRAYLRSRGVAHVMDSRQTAFAGEVLNATDRQGVHVVLNSLAGDGMRASLDAIGRYGRFVELGKRDLWGHEGLPTEPFRKNLSYFAVDLAAMVEERADAFGRLLRLVMAGLANGTWRPLPVEGIAIGQVRDAFHRLAAGRHSGKLAVQLTGAPAALIARRREIGADATYLITGGLGGLGLRIAEWLVEQGARHVALMGRRAPGDAAASAIASMTARGARVQVCQADVADRAQVERVIASLAAPLRGVVHAAAELADMTLEKLSPDSIGRVWRPKAIGAWNLHVATLAQDLDFFVVMSSVAALLGSPGQGHYAAANTWADALVSWRRTRGLPGLTIHWGPWGDVGLAAASDGRGARLAERGMASLAPGHALAILGRVLWDDRAQVAAMRLDLRQWQQYYPKTAASPMLRALGRDAEAPAGRSAVRASLEEAAPEARRALLEQCIREQLARVLRLEPSKVPATAPFSSLGFDSLIAIEFRNRLESSLGLKLSATLAWAHPTVPELADHLARRMNLGLEPAVSPAADGASRIAAMTEAEAEAELVARLRAT